MLLSIWVVLKKMIYTVDEIKNITIPIAKEYGVNSMSLFGSYARGEAIEGSDIDILIDIGNIHDLLEYAGFINDLEDALGCNVDVITTTSNNQDFINNIRKDEVKIL